MANKIQIKRGLRADLPAILSVGELAYCTDTKELFIGTGNAQAPNLLINDLSNYYTEAEIQALAGDGLSWDAALGEFKVNSIFDSAGNYENLRAQATTAADVDLGNVTNESKATMFTNPTFTGTVAGVTATHVGLGNVTNESKATMFIDPTFTGTVSGVTATHVGLGNVTNESKATMFTDPTFTGTVSGVTATHVGLGNVTNESKATMFTDPTFTGTVTVPNPTASTSAATKGYVDEAAEGLRTRPSVRAATTTNLAAIYDNGPNNDGIGATLTADTNRAFGTLDGVTGWAITSPRQGVLVKNQTNAAHNGRYILDVLGQTDVSAWVLKRCPLCDESDEIPGSYTFVIDGTVNEGTGWVQIVNDPSTFVVGTDAINVFQFSGAGTYTAGTGLTLTGTAFAIDNTVLTTTNLLTAGDELTGAVKYNALTSASGQFYGGTTDPSATTRLNYSGNLHTTNLNVVTLATVGRLAITDTTKTTGQFYSGTTDPTNSDRLNYDGNLHITNLTAITLATVGRLSVTDTSRTAGHLYAGSTDPISTNRLNYDGYFYATKFFGGIDYATTAPTANNTEGVKIAILTTEPGTKYTGWLYFIQG